jgi:hypothetical protein
MLSKKEKELFENSKSSLITLIRIIVKVILFYY